MNGELSRRTVGALGAIALLVGLLGAGVAACDLTQPNRFKQDSTSGSDSGSSRASLSPAEAGPIPVFLQDGAAG